jgi:predicted DNA-binding transcriptional regulator AlpA
MRPELQTVLDSLPRIAREHLPELYGELELVRATVWQRLSAPAAAPVSHDELLDVAQASERLGCSRDYLYRHHHKFPFTRRMGRKLVFSSLEIDRYIKTRRGCE